jgi:hypothetical protein
VRYAAVVKSGDAFEIEMRWSNQAVGRAVRDFYLVLTLDERKVEGGVIPCRGWIKGESHDVAKRINLDVPPGEYNARFYLEDRKHRQRIALPLKGGKERTYPLGPVRVVAR